MLPLAATTAAVVSGNMPPNQPLPMWYGSDIDVYRMRAGKTLKEANPSVDRQASSIGCLQMPNGSSFLGGGAGSGGAALGGGAGAGSGAWGGGAVCAGGGDVLGTGRGGGARGGATGAGGGG